jgi:hypothetical protein
MSDETLNESELKKLLQLAEKATPGPWKVYKTPYTLTELGRAQGFKEDRKSVVNAIGQAWDHPQLKGPLPIVTTTHGPYYDPQHAVKIEDVDADHIAAFDPSTCAELVREVLRLRKEVKDAAEDLQSAANEARWSAIQGDEYGGY